MVKKEICGITVIVEGRNPPHKRDGYRVRLDDTDNTILGEYQLTGKVYRATKHDAGDHTDMKIPWKTRKDIEHAIVNCWMCTHPKHDGRTAAPAGGCRGSG